MTSLSNLLCGCLWFVLEILGSLRICEEKVKALIVFERRQVDMGHQ